PRSPSLTFKLQQFFPLSSWILFMVSQYIPSHLIVTNLHEQISAATSS
ncbi:hypothetical protein WG66_001624, partial [Moniliophthora roreri]